MTQPAPLHRFDDGDVPVVAPRVACRNVDGEEVAVRLDDMTLFILGGSATTIWSWIEGRRDVRTLAASLAAWYGVERAEADEVVRAFLGALAERRLIAVEAGPGDLGPVEAPDAPRAYEPPAVLHEDPLEVLAVVCNTSYAGRFKCRAGPHVCYNVST